MLNLLCRRCLLRHMHTPLGRNSFIYRLQTRLFLTFSSNGNVHDTQIRLKSPNLSNYLQWSKHIGLDRRWLSTMNGNVSTNEETVENLYSIHYIYVQTSVDRWHESPEGLQFDVCFADSMPSTNTNAPVIVGLPSSIGCHKDLMKVLLVFVKYGCRVIIPNMPGTKLSKCRSRSEATIFTNSVDEKQEYVADFLSELGIKKVDMLVTDSDSVYTGVSLCSLHSDIFKAFAMINPTGLEYTKYMSPLLLFKNINRLWDEVFYMQPICWVFIAFFKMFTSKRGLSTNDLITFSKTVSYLDFQEVASEILNIRDVDIPLLALYGEESKYLAVESTEEMLHMMGIPESNRSVYSKDWEIVTKGCKDAQNRSFKFEGTAQDIIDTRTKILRTKLLEFYKNVKSVKH